MTVSRQQDATTRILIVDDDALARTFASEALRPSGFEILEADDGCNALPVIRDRRPDLVILDVVMPVLDGFDTCRAIRELPGGADIPVLIMTGADDVESMNLAYEAGATDFANKGMVYQLPYRVRHLLRAKRMADELRLSKKYLQNAQGMARLGHWRARPGSGQAELSGMVFEILGIEPESPFLDWKSLQACLHPDEREDFRLRVENAVANGCEFRGEHRILRPDGSLRFVDVQLQVQVVDGEPELFGICQDTTDSRMAEEKINFLAYYDRLTGLPNRAFLMNHLDAALRHAASNDEHVGFVAVGIDNFSELNETFGFALGDALIVNVAERLKGGMHEYDIQSRDTTSFVRGDAGRVVARLDRDGFVVVFSGLPNQHDIRNIGAQIMHSLAAPVEFEGRDYHLTASAGVSVFPRDGNDGEMLLTCANLAMQQARVESRRTLMEYRPDMHAGAARRVTLTDDLRRAVEQGALSLHYQPQVSAANGELTGVEALLRWQHPQQGFVSPADFIPLAEASGLIVPIGDWVLETACRQRREWLDQGLPPFRVAVNLASEQLAHDPLVDRVMALLSDYGLDPAWLELEITEGSLIRDVSLSAGVLERLRGLGVPIAVDDFGTGYSSLSYLQSFAVDALKIDRSFVQDIGRDESSGAIVRAIIAMSHSLGLQVVAEGVEEAGQLAFLRQQGCDVVQGYYYSRPLPASDVAAWLRASSRKRPIPPLPVTSTASTA